MISDDPILPGLGSDRSDSNLDRPGVEMASSVGHFFQVSGKTSGGLGRRRAGLQRAVGAEGWSVSEHDEATAGRITGKTGCSTS